MRNNHFFYLPRRDRRAIMTVLVLLAVGFSLYSLLNNPRPEASPVSPIDSLSVGKGNKFHARESAVYRYDEPSARVNTLFPFDPNTADSTDLLTLGFSPYQVRNIYRYRSKGGTFRHKEDLSRIYGITERQYRELEPYITISKDYQQAVARYHHETDEQADRDTIIRPKKLTLGQTIALNETDSNLLKQVPGIGSSYAKRINAYRERLGGFVSTDQLYEIEGIPDDVADYFRTDHKPVRQININRLTAKQLHRHPYLTFVQSKAIVDYRRLKGPIKGINDLKLMKEFTADDIRRLAPYLAF